jgi:hypothetical protein
MSMDNLIKYLIWVAFFVMAAVGLYFLLKRIGVL